MQISAALLVIHLYSYTLRLKGFLKRWTFSAGVVSDTKQRFRRASGSCVQCVKTGDEEW